MDDYLIDTSVWILFFGKNSDVVENRILNLIARNRVAYNGVILSELLFGAKNNKNIDSIIDTFTGLRFLEMDRDFFVHSSRLNLELRKKGLTVPMADVMILTHAKLNRLIVFSQDKHFEQAGLAVGVQFEVIKNFDDGLIPSGAKKKKG